MELAPRDQVINAINFNFSNSLEFPRFVDYLGVYKLANKLGLLKDRQYDALKNGASSILNADYEYVDLVDFYRYQSIDLDFWFSQYLQYGKYGKTIANYQPFHHLF